MKIEVNWNIGKFDVTAETEVSESLIKPLLERGVLHVLQRSSEIDKVLGIVVKDGDKTKRLPIKRNDVPYEKEMAERLEAALSSATITDDEELEFSITVGEYVGGGTKEPAFAYEKKLLKAKLASGQSYEISAANIKYEGQLVDDDGEPTTDFAKALKQFLSATAF